ncbi:FecCD family ABC transporter permease [Hoeflea sp.]|uniref:FecCD family ABC transporter permease n=1 Tax=Hoeflea sp. TaxID=1940281 RepID=UPI003BAE7428
MLQRTDNAAGLRLQKTHDGDRSRLARSTAALLAVALIATAAAALGFGAADTPAYRVLMTRIGFLDGAGLQATDYLIVEQIRLPRLFLGMLIGAGLAVSGALMQGLFRNPLADPGIVGVSAGAGLGAVAAIVLGGGSLPFFGIYSLPFAAFFGGLVSTWLLYQVSTRNGATSVATLLLAGIALGALAGAITGFLVYLADDAQLRDITFWGLGSLAGATWTKVAATAPFVVLALAVSSFLARALNALALGEAAAHHMGIPVQRMKLLAITVVAAATGASVAASGVIGFVGIVIPHLLRLTIGPDHRYLLICSALLGASFLTLADAVSRTVVAPAELPIGIVTAAIGAPFFLWILLGRRGMADL